MSEYKQTAEQILVAVGNKDNIIAITHCATRLRLVLKNESKINTDEIEKIDLVKGHFLTAGQFQIILGTGIVNKVTSELISLTGISEVSTQEAKDLGAGKGNLLQRFIKTLSDVFVPIIPAIVAGGLLMGLNNILTSPDLFVKGKTLIEAYPQWASIAAMINTFSNAPFVFLPVLIAFSATRIFGGNPILGAVLGMIMVHPDLTNNYSLANAIANNELQYWNLFGTQIAKVGYQGTVLPILVSSYILAKLEINLRKIIPQSLDLLLTPLLAIFITALLTFLFVGPWARDAGLAFTNFIQWLYNSLGFIGGAAFGSVYAPIVITGMHNSFIPVETQLIADVARTGGTFVFPIAAMNNVAQGAAAFAVLFTIADKKLKSIASPAGVSAVLGITEPAMFGVNLRLRYPFYAALIGTALASAFITLFKVKAVALGAAGLLGVISISAQSLIPYIIGMIISFGVTFALTIYFSKAKRFNPDNKELIIETSTEEIKNNHNSEIKEDETLMQNNLQINSWKMPLEGKFISLKDIPDPVFSSGAMGCGFGIDPINNKVIAPVDGKVTSVFPTKHAIGFETLDGVELLIHIGIDTVNLKGKGFTSYIKDGDIVKAGDALIEFDLNYIQSNAPSAITIIVFPNIEDKEISIQDDKLIFE